MKRGEWHEAARQLHETRPDWSNGQIARALGVTTSAVWRVLNPEKIREQDRRQNVRRRTTKREWEREWTRSEQGRGRCANPVCGHLKGIGGNKSSRLCVYCHRCRLALADVRRTLTEGMWAEGWTVYEIEAALGVNSRGGYVGACRARGWDLPHRRTLEQIERIVAGRWNRAVGDDESGSVA